MTSPAPITEYHFRQSAGTTWAEVNPATYWLPTDIYPTTRNGLTFGYVGAGAGGSANITSSPANARTSGRHLISNTTIERIDLADGPGTYKIWISLGGLNTAVATSAKIYDGNGTSGPSSGTLLADLTSTTPISGHVTDATLTDLTVAGWLGTADGMGTAITVTVTSDHIFIGKGATSEYINFVATQLQVVPLTDIALSNESDSGPVSTIYAGEPAGKIFGTLSSASGAQSFAVVSSPYFSVATIDGKPRLIATATRLPDTYTGGVTVRQTTPYETRDTVIPFSATSIGRQFVGGILDLLSSETWYNRNRVLAVTQGEKWAGYNGQSLASSQAVTGLTDLVNKVTALNPDGTSWYEMRLQNGSYPVTAGTAIPYKNFGNGGLRIIPDAGHDPQFLSYIIWQVHGLDWSGTIFNPANDSYSLYFPCPNGPLTPAKYNKIKLHDNRPGAMWAGDVPGNYNNWGTWVQCDYGQGVEIVNNDMWGLKNTGMVSGTRGFSYKFNRLRNVQADALGVTTAFREWQPVGQFADNSPYCEIGPNLCEISSPDVSNSHPDFVQIRRFMGNCYPYLTRPNGNINAVWAVGDYTINMTEMKIYAVASVQTGALGEPAGVGAAGQPPATGALTTGGVTFAFHRDYTTAAPIYILLTENVCLADGTSFIDVGGNRILPGRKLLINSNDSIGCPAIITCIQNVFASPEDYGISGGEGEIHAEFNTMGGPTQVPPTSTQALQILDSAINGRGKVRARKNVLGKAVSSSKADVTTGGGTLYEQDNIPVSHKIGTVAPYRPQDVYRGAWANNADGVPVATLRRDGLGAMADLRSDVSKLFHSQAGLVGAMLDEVHTVTVTDALGHTGTFDIIVSPNAPIPVLPASAPLITVTPGHQSATISLSETALNGGTIQDHQLYLATSSLPAVHIGALSDSGPWTQTGLTNGVAYSFQISTVTQFGESALSAPVVVVPRAVMTMDSTVFTADAQEFYEPSLGASLTATRYLQWVNTQIAAIQGIS